MLIEDLNTLKVAKYKCEKDLLFFTRYFYKQRTGDKFVLNWHHEEICRALEAVVKGDIKNLLINVPPRHSKTELVVINFIPWVMGWNPKAKFIHLSYSDDLALDNSGKAKELIESDEYQQLWNIGLKSDSKSKKKWYTEQGGGVYATASGGAITGFGAGSTVDTGKFEGAIIIDDPHKVDDVASEVARKAVTDRLNTTIKSRRNNRKTPIIIIMQRLHEEDMSGFVLAGKMGEDFHHLKIPALDENENPLWAYKHTKDELIRMRTVDPYGFSGQYMQEPSPLDGEYFKRDWIRWYDKAPAKTTLRMYGGSDYAVTADGGDYTVHGIVGVDPNDDIYVLDWWRKQTSSDEWIEVFIDLVNQHKVLMWGEEPGQIRSSLDPIITKRMRERKVYCYRNALPSTKDKAVRAQAIRARMAMGKVYFPRNAPWVEPLIDELMKFPNGKNDDQVDVLSIIGRMLDSMVAGSEDDARKKRDIATPPTMHEIMRRMEKSNQNDEW